MKKVVLILIGVLFITGIVFAEVNDPKYKVGYKVYILNLLVGQTEIICIKGYGEKKGWVYSCESILGICYDIKENEIIKLKEE